MRQDLYKQLLPRMAKPVNPPGRQRRGRRAAAHAQDYAMSVTVRHQKRRNLAFRMTPSGPEVLVPQHIDPESEAVQRFIEEALAKLPEPEPVDQPLTVEQLQTMVAKWCDKLSVSISRVQVRQMRNKWGSISTAGTLTLADDILALPPDLAEYIVVHELLHLKFPDHRQGWQVSMGMYVPDWRERERRLAGYVPREGELESD